MSGEDAAVIYALETTEQRALEQQFAQSQKMQAVGQLAGGIAHDFNNMLTAIIGFSDLLLTNHRPTDPSFQDIMNIKQNANRAAGLVRQLLAFSRRQTLRPKVIELGEVLSDISVLLDAAARRDDQAGGRARPRRLADQGRPEPARAGDREPRRQRARRHAGRRQAHHPHLERGRRRKAQQFREQGFKPGEYVLVEVTDTGTGMPPEVMEKIFEPFFTTKGVGQGHRPRPLDRLRHRQADGRLHLRRFQARARARPSASSCRATRPRPRRRPEDVEKPAAAPADLTGSARILLVEDEEAVRAFAGRALTARGYKVFEAASGPEALDLMNGMQEPLDLVISDVVMPGMDGPTLMRELRRQQPELKIIFVSGYAEDAFERHLSPDEKNFQFLPKPFSLKELATTVKETLEG